MYADDNDGAVPNDSHQHPYSLGTAFCRAMQPQYDSPRTTCHCPPNPDWGMADFWNDGPNRVAVGYSHFGGYPGYNDRACVSFLLSGQRRAGRWRQSADASDGIRAQSQGLAVLSAAVGGFEPQACGRVGAGKHLRPSKCRSLSKHPAGRLQRGLRRHPFRASPRCEVHQNSPHTAPGRCGNLFLRATLLEVCESMAGRESLGRVGTCKCTP